MSLGLKHLKSLTAVMMCLAFTSSAWAQIQVNQYDEPIEYKDLNNDDLKKTGPISKGCQTKDADGVLHPVYISAHGVCQLYLIADTIRLVGTLYPAEGKWPEKCTYPMFQTQGEKSFIIAKNPNFHKAKFSLDKAYAQQLTPQKNPLPAVGAFYEMYINSNKAINMVEDDKGKHIRTYESEHEATQAMKAIPDCQKDSVTPGTQQAKDSTLDSNSSANAIHYDGRSGAATP